MNVDVRIAGLEEKEILSNLMQYYFYDFSEYLKYDIEDIGQYGQYEYLDYYWTDKDRFPYLIFCEGKLAGFVLVRNIQSNGNSYFSIAEFFVMRKYRRQGIGKEVAIRIFKLHKGNWEVYQVESNKPAQKFWNTVIGEYTNGNFKNRIEDGRVFQEFVS